MASSEDGPVSWGVDTGEIGYGYITWVVDAKEG
jgi:hypothetical protein